MFGQVVIGDRTRKQRLFFSQVFWNEERITFKNLLQHIVHEVILHKQLYVIDKQFWIRFKLKPAFMLLDQAQRKLWIRIKHRRHVLQKLDFEPIGSITRIDCLQQFDCLLRLALISQQGRLFNFQSWAELPDATNLIDSGV